MIIIREFKTIYKLKLDSDSPQRVFSASYGQT